MSSQQPPSGRDIPLLTEVLAPAPTSPALAESSEPDAGQETPSPAGAHHHADNARDIRTGDSTQSQWPAAAAPAMDEEARWRHIAQDIQEQVLQQLLGQVNSLLKQQVAEQMAIAFEHVTQQLTAQIQVNLEQALQQSVLLAVEQEIEKTRMMQNKDF